MEAEITIGMPLYNERKYIEKTLESVFNQTYQNFELVISDNHSDDGTDEICQKYAERDKRVRFFRQKENIGALENFKFVLDQARTPFFIWLSGHDIWHPQLLEKLLYSFKKSKDSDLILVFPKVIVPSLNIEYKWLRRWDTSHIGNPIERYKIILQDLGSFAVYGLWKTEALRKIKFRKTIVSDALILASASLIGKFKIEEEAIFYRTINHPPMNRKSILIRQIKNLYPKNKIYEVAENITSQKYRDFVYSLILAFELMKFILGSVKICLSADKLNKNITQKEKIYLALWSILSIPYSFYIFMPENKYLQVYGKLFESLYKIKRFIYQRWEK